MADTLVAASCEEYQPIRRICLYGQAALYYMCIHGGTYLLKHREW